MKNRICADTVICSILFLFIGAVLVQGETDSAEREITITNASFVAPSPEREILNGEWVEISNQGESDENLAGWKLEDRQNHTYTFPDFTLSAGASVRIHTGVGSDTSEDLHWNRNTAIWNNDGDTATLKDASGDIVSRYPEEAKGA
ncbi:Lamin Tail Domain protein [uncultured archaeon]|nr:Lamin Tail Domain protein [uncultured archaeon]